MPDENTVNSKRIADYMVILMLALLIIFYSTLIFLARNSIGTIGTSILLGLGILALLMWTKQLWEKAGTSKNEARIIPGWQRLLLGIFALMGLIAFASALSEILRGAYSNSIVDYFRLLVGFAGCLLFLFIALKGRLPGFFVKRASHDS